MDKNNLAEIKKLFTTYSNVNFFNDFTLQDVEEAQKKAFIALSMEQPQEKEKIKKYLEASSNKLMENKFLNGSENKNVGVVVKNTVRDSLNPNYKNTVKRLLCIDSQYRPNIYNYNDTDTNECDFTVNLSEKLVNVVNMQIEYIQIPYTFYNIEARKSNNYFMVDTSMIEVPDGYYTLTTLMTTINVQLITNGVTDVSFVMLPSNYKVNIQNKSSNPKTITFFDSLDIDNMSDIICNTKNTTYLNTKGNNSLGWYLGFRDISLNENSVKLEYIMNGNTNITGDAVAAIPNTKYFTVVVNDYNQNQANGTIVQPKLDLNYIKPTTYFNFQNTSTNKTLDCLTCDNMMNDYIKDENRTLTRAQLYSRAEINKNKSFMKIQPVYRLDCKTMNHVLAVLPFDPTKPFGELYFNDKIDYKREYHGPVEIEKLHIQIYDDKGILLNLNGNDWYIAITTEHLYKY
jgi:hypothetical protein